MDVEIFDLLCSLIAPLFLDALVKKCPAMMWKNRGIKESEEISGGQTSDGLLFPVFLGEKR